MTSRTSTAAFPSCRWGLGGGEFGKGKAGGKVAHVREEWYGLKPLPLLWERHLKRFLTEELGARTRINDRNVFAVNSLEIRHEFMRWPRALFKITGGKEEATKFHGLEITRDWDAHTV